MIDCILGELAKTTFDFRAYANPSDPLSPLRSVSPSLGEASVRGR